MKYNLSFHKRAWNECLYWWSQDKKTLKKINSLIEPVCRGSLIAKSEKLEGNLSGCNNLRINDKDRLVYKIMNDYIQIVQLRGHNNDKWYI